MVQPTDGQSVQDLAKHIDQDWFWRAVGWIIGGLAAIAATLLGYIGVKESRKTSALFRWKDEVVDPALRDLPRDYVMKKDLNDLIVVPNAADHAEIKATVTRVEQKLDQLLLK